VNLAALAIEHASSEAVIKAAGDCFAAYDTLNEHLYVMLANSLETHWIAKAE
jgi:hypothetical protein